MRKFFVANWYRLMDKSSAINYRNNLLKDTIELYDLKHCGKKDKNTTKKTFFVSCDVMSCKRMFFIWWYFYTLLFQVFILKVIFFDNLAGPWSSQNAFSYILSTFFMHQLLTYFFRFFVKNHTFDIFLNLPFLDKTFMQAVCIIGWEHVFKDFEY